MNSSWQDSRQRHHRHRPHHHHKHHHRTYFKKPLVLISSIPRNGETDVSPDIKAIKLIFGRDFNNDRGWVNVYNEIDMWQGMNKVPIRIQKSIDKNKGHRIILVIPLHPLLGGVTYKVRVKSYFVDKHGEELKRIKLIVFTTGCRQ